MILRVFNFLDKLGLTAQEHTRHRQVSNSALARQLVLQPKVMLLTFLFLFGCSDLNKEVFLTKEMPVAKVGSPYYAEIKMKEYRVIEDTFVVKSNIDQNSGLIVSSGHGGKQFAAHALTKIEGTPTRSGLYKINISGTVRDGLKGFNRDFILNVEE